jgi:hypothetical protein
MEKSLLVFRTFIGIGLVVAAKAKLGRLIVVRFEKRRVGHSVNRRNHDQDAKQVGQKWLENRFEHSALIVAQPHLLFSLEKEGYHVLSKLQAEMK